MSPGIRSQKILRATYTAVSPVYDTLVPAVSSKARSLAINLLEIEDGDRVLDAGCGTGIALEAIAKANRSGETVGLDATPDMSERARRRLKDTPTGQYRVRVGTITDLPYPANSFDTVLSSYVLDVLPTDAIEPALHELMRVLRPKGRLVLVYLAAPRTPLERALTAVVTYFPIVMGGARPIRLQPKLRNACFTIRDSKTRSQLGLRSRIVRAIPS